MDPGLASVASDQLFALHPPLSRLALGFVAMPGPLRDSVPETAKCREGSERDDCEGNKLGKHRTLFSYRP